ncbi:MAG: TlpA family protein disulfide reductase [Pseudomonadales bacterium]|nr:TlpA family protein disulfide reductase [Pseudomonadales bacterium]
MRIAIALMLSALLLSGCEQPEFYDTEGKGYRFADLRGKYLIVNYWATWCGPCIKEIPELNELADTHRDRLTVWGVNFDEPEGDEMRAQVSKMKITFPVFSANPSAQLGVETPQVLPTTLIFDPAGKLLKTLVGPQTEASLLAQLDSN